MKYKLVTEAAQRRHPTAESQDEQPTTSLASQEPSAAFRSRLQLALPTTLEARRVVLVWT